MIGEANMSDNYPPGVSEGMLPGNSDADARFQFWYEENEDRLLSEFLDGLREEYGEEMPVKEWTDAIRADFDNYVQSEYED
jgi:hypothetical protein